MAALGQEPSNRTPGGALSRLSWSARLIPPPSPGRIRTSDQPVNSREDALSIKPLGGVSPLLKLGNASKYLFLIRPAHNSEIFLENWKANPTLNSSIPMGVAWGALGSSYKGGSRAKDQQPKGHQQTICISFVRSAARRARPPSKSVSREIMLISTA